MRTVVLSGLGISALLYLSVGVCGALAFGEDVAPNLLLSFPVASAAGPWSTASGVVARLAITFTVACTYPVVMHPARNSFALVCCAKPAASCGGGVWAVLTMTLWIASVCIALLVSSLDLALGLVGGSTGMLIGFVFPAVFFDRIRARTPAATAHEKLIHPHQTHAQGRQGVVVEEDGSTPYALAGGGEDVQDIGRRAGARMLAVGGTLLIPVLVGAQALKAARM